MKFLIALLCASVALMAADPLWSDLLMTWSINPINAYAFEHIPRDLNFSIMGYYEKENFCEGGKPKGLFAGRRYWRPGDTAVFPLYDVNYIIAGLQMAVKKTDWGPSDYNLNHPVIDDGEYYVLTAYFVDPSIICSKGRTNDDLHNYGTGTGVYIQNGTNPLTDYIQVPYTEYAAQEESSWTKGHCFYTMGDHFYYNVREDMNCDEFFPFGLMYNKGKLNGFIFYANAKLNSWHYENPSIDFFGKLIDPLPQCFRTFTHYQELTSMHVYFSPAYFDLC